LNYWECGEWLGFGESAKSHFNEPWTREDEIMLGLRLMWGIDKSLVADKMDIVNDLVAHKLLKIKNDRISCTNRGFNVLSAITIKLI
jgi:coproporphyrinogen III oxidase-like Fe-S oxidoreductase